jgi:hypothetical protein
MDHSPSASIDRPDIVKKVTRRLIPFVGICYLIAYIDRQNVSFAKLQMVGDLGLSEYAYGLGASLFFIGYFFFEVPSNVIMACAGRSGAFLPPSPPAEKSSACQDQARKSSHLGHEIAPFPGSPGADGRASHRV